MIERYQIRYFLAVVETGSFSRAAERVNVTQPTLSAGIAKLETGIGSVLFLRNSQRVSLTADGNRFLAQARVIESAFHELENREVATGPMRVFRLGMLRSVPTLFMEQVLAHYRASGAADQLELIDGSERELLSGLATGRLDAAVTLARDNSHFGQEPLFHEGYALAMPRDHPLAHLPEIGGAELANEVMIVRRSCEVLSETSRYFTNLAVRPHFSFRSLNDDRVLALVGAGLGITVMPESHRHPAVVRPRLAGFALRRQIALVSAPNAAANGDSPPPVIAAIRAVAKRFVPI